MIRFEPDTWVDAVLRPFAMAAPNGGVYVEIIAPDFRFVFAIGLLAAWLLLRRPDARPRPALTLLGFCALAFVPWLITSGNGRYFVAVLLLAGPLCVALLYQLRLRRRVLLSLLAGMIALQLFLLRQNEPWSSWGLKPWKDGPAFAVDVPPDLKARPASYVAVNSISWSLIAPQFHPASRWISLASQRGGDDTSPDGLRTRAFLQARDDLFVVLPSAGGEIGNRRPPEDLLVALNDTLANHRLQVAPTTSCRLLPSSGLTQMGLRSFQPEPTQPSAQRGFWICPLHRLAAGMGPVKEKPAPEIEAVFEKLERTCPRMFPPGHSETTVLWMGARRLYADSDMRLYVLKDGQVMYKYMRALNPVAVGDSQAVLADGFRMDCNNIRGRSGLPWEREI